MSRIAMHESNYPELIYCFFGVYSILSDLHPFINTIYFAEDNCLFFAKKRRSLIQIVNIKNKFCVFRSVYLQA